MRGGRGRRGGLHDRAAIVGGVFPRYINSIIILATCTLSPTVPKESYSPPATGAGAAVSGTGEILVGSMSLSEVCFP